jgi:hypothetical protein
MATFNNTNVYFSYISYNGGALEETRVPGENHWPATSYWHTLSHNVASSTPRLSGIQTHVSGDKH